MAKERAAESKSCRGVSGVREKTAERFLEAVKLAKFEGGTIRSCEVMAKEYRELYEKLTQERKK